MTEAAGGARPVVPGPDAGRTRRIAFVAGLGAIVVGLLVIAYSLTSPLAARDPQEFLPGSTRAVVSLDLRSGSPGMKALGRTWSRADRRRLAERGIKLAQEVVGWTGVELDLERDVAPWFGGMAVAAVVAPQEREGFGPAAWALVVRARDMRKARRSLDRAFQPMAEELHWRRVAVSGDAGRVTVWRSPRGADEVAYALREGCAVIAGRGETVAACLAAAHDPKTRLAGRASFRGATAEMGLREAVLWVYLDLPFVRQGRRLLPSLLRRDWLGALRELRVGRSSASKQEARSGSDSALAIVVAPHRDGVGLRARHWTEKPPGPPPERSQLAALAKLVPQESDGYLLIHAASEWGPKVPVLASGGRVGAPTAALPVPVPLPRFTWAELPNNLLVVFLPGKEASRPALVVAAPSEEFGQHLQSAAELVLGLKAKAYLRESHLRHFAVLATDGDALERCRRALQTRRHRRMLPGVETARMALWARPARLSRHLGQVQELRVQVRQAGQGFEAELALRARPGDLLGGRE